MVETILVTGASGFLGAHVLVQLLDRGYRVRVSARGPKVAEMKKNYAKHGDKFEVVVISDIVADQFPDALKDIDAIIHCATPLPGKTTAETMLNNTIEGTMNIVRQAEKAKIKRVVMASSLATVVNPKFSFTDKDWYPATKESVLTDTSYHAAKTLAERELWDFADAHPDMEITTINPSFLYGPFAEGFTISGMNHYAMATNLFIYSMLFTTGTFPPTQTYADVRDAAKAHILALTAPPTSAVGRKRMLFSSPHGFKFQDILDTIAEKRPELKERLTKVPPPKLPLDRVPIDFNRLEEVLGLKKTDFKAVEETILGTVDSVLTIEKQWISEGHEITVPEPPTV